MLHIGNILNNNIIMNNIYYLRNEITDGTVMLNFTETYLLI